MVADSALPVWTIRPNWREPVLERLEWMTDVIEASDGNEQRRALRLSPRRSFEMTFNPFNADRSYFDLFLHRLGAEEFMVPLWHDQAKVNIALAAGVTAIPVDTTYREFVAGGMALIVGADPHVFDAIEITAVTDTQITAGVGEVTRSWPAGARIYPLRRARLSDESMFAAITNRVGQATLEFQLNQANDIASEGEWEGETYLGLPVIATPPNRKEQIDLSYLRKLTVLDNDQGLRYLTDEADRAFTTQMHYWQMRGRQEHWEFRQMLYRLRGKQTPVWLPTFNDDLTLARDVSAAGTAVHVNKIGYAYTGGVQPGREHIMFRTSAGNYIAKISGTGAPLAADEERLNLTAAVGADLAAGRSASFLEASRLDHDTVEITHYTDTDGMAECKTTFRSFANTRAAPAIIYYPIPTTEQEMLRCGEPAEGGAECADVPFVSTWWRLRVECRFEGRHGDPISGDPDIGSRSFYWDPPTVRTVNQGCIDPMAPKYWDEAIGTQFHNECVNFVVTPVVQNELLDPNGYGFQYTFHGDVPLVLPDKFHLILQYDLGTWSDIGLDGTPLDFFFSTEGYPEQLIYTSWQNHGGAHHHYFARTGGAVPAW